MGLRTEIKKLKNKITRRKAITHYKDLYMKDKNYIKCDIKNCFKDRLIKSDDTKILKRIVTAYQKTLPEYKNAKSAYRVNSIWEPIYKKSFEDIIEILTTGHIEKLEEKYQNFWRNNAAAGLIGLALDMSNCFKKEIGKKDKDLYLDDYFNRIYYWKDQTNLDNYNVLSSPQIGNPYGAELDGQFIKAGADYLHYYAFSI